MFDRRCRGYEAVGYTIVVPASAVPGWPADVPLPSHPPWKREYSASVKRLIRDGADASLGNLFVNAVTVPAPGAEGADRARSATEAFLYRRLETLLPTRGRFRLNAALPIPFDNRGRMEVDLLCADARLAIELDGAQHLESTDAYRRDRVKINLVLVCCSVQIRFRADASVSGETHPATACHLLSRSYASNGLERISVRILGLTDFRSTRASLRLDSIQSLIRPFTG